MQGKFLSNLLFLVLLNLLVKPLFILGIDAEVQLQVGTENYGNYFALLNFTFLFNILLDLGLTNYNNRSVSRDPSKLKSEYPVILGLKSLLLLAYVLVCCSIGLILDFSNEQWDLLLVLFFNQFLVSMLLYARSNLAALQRFKHDSIISILDRTLLIIFCSVLLWGNVTDRSFQIEWFVYAQTISYGLTLITAFIFMPANFRFVLPRFDLKQSRAILKKSLPYALLVLLMMIYNRTDSVMLERLLDTGKHESGEYALGFRLFDAVNMFAMLFAVILLPMLSKMIKQNQSVNTLVNISFKLLMSFGIPLALLCFYFSEEVLELRYHSVSSNAAFCFSWLMLSFLGVCFTYIFGTLLTANGNMKALNYMALTGIIVNIALNSILIPEHGAEGAAIATFVTQISTGLIQLFLAQYFFKLEVIKSLLFPLGIYFLACFGLIYLVQDQFVWHPAVLLSSFALCILLAWILGNIQIKPFIKDLRNKQ